VQRASAGYWLLVIHGRIRRVVVVVLPGDEDPIPDGVVKFI
jgi:hypothetical protein